jgi:hypothetical protein
VKRCQPDCAGRRSKHKKSSSVKLLLNGNKNFLAATLAQLEGLRRRCLVHFFFAHKKIVLSVALKSRRCHSPRNYSLRYPFGAKFVYAYFFSTFKFPSFKMKFLNGFSEICFAAANRRKSHDAIHKLQHM